jgi:thioredoxin reductase
MYDLIIIGGGPAALAATAYALGKGLDVAMVYARFGGKAGQNHLVTGRDKPNYLLGLAAVNECKGEIAASQVPLINDIVIRIIKRDDVFDVVGENGTLQAYAVIVATGAQPTLLGIPHEWSLIGHGLGYSIPTHAPATAGRCVAVVGSTMRALRGVAELVQWAEQVTLIAPQTGDLNSPLGQRLRDHPGVQLFEGYRVVEVETHNEQVQAIVIARRSDIQRLPVSSIFAALRLVPSTEMVRDCARLDRYGRLVVDNQQQTTLPGLFAAGDVTNTGGEQILSAIGDGGRAAMHAYDYILAQKLGVSSAEMVESS